MSDHLNTENAGSVIEFSDLAGLCELIKMRISEIERQLYVVRRGCGDIDILSLEHLRKLYSLQQLLLRESAVYGANHDQ